VDVAGEVIDPGATELNKGDKVCANGWGIGDELDGGYATVCAAPAKAVSAIPDGLSERHAAAIGVAGFTAMLCALALVNGEVVPESGPVAVSGATGGVGSFSVAILAAAGYDVYAITGKQEEADYLIDLGAREVMPRSDFDRDAKPLEKATLAGAVDSVGSKTLATLLARVKHKGVVAACGLAGGPELNTTVMPFILRAVSLVGIDASRVPHEEREDAWRRLSEALDPETIDKLHQVAPVTEALDYARKQLNGKLRQRVVFELD
jgi:acrylyl-CoA reductase (NADPH)